MTTTQPAPASAATGHTGLTFKQAVGRRRSIRFFKPYQPVDKGKVQKVLEAARLQSQHGNAVLIRKAVVVYRDETDQETFAGLCEAMYNQPAAAQAPCHIYWTIDMSGWDELKPSLLKLIEVGALTSSYGWSEQFIDDIVMKTPDFNVLAGDRTFAEWLSAIETGLAMGAALLAAQDEGLGTALLTGQRARIGELLGMPENTTVAQIQLLGYPAEGEEAGGQRPRPDFEQLYFEGRWGNPMRRDPAVVAELEDAGMIQAAAPLAHRRQEIRAMAAMFGLPE
ncbi:nitroreductase family protein [Actinokineospora sp.]|uniref:nitroreductase family protein n=1 Tax=Actinokineospora sp. TaxID=1872133 RepID=UPI0040381E93